MTEERAWSELSPAVAAPLRAAFDALSGAVPSADEPRQYRNLRVASSPAGLEALREPLGEALRAAGWPAFSESVPLADTLTAEQRAIALLVAPIPDLPLHAFAIPQTAWARRRWIGLDPPGPSDAPVGGRPLWRALGDERIRELPVGVRVGALLELGTGAWRTTGSLEIPEEELDADDGAWAPALADRVLAWFEPGAPRGERGMYSSLRWVPTAPLFYGLVRRREVGGGPIEPRWDALLPAPYGSWARRVLEALPEERRGRALARVLAGQFPRAGIEIGLEHLRWIPDPALLEQILDSAEEGIGSLAACPRRLVYARAREIVAGRPDLVAAIDARPVPEVPELRVRATREPSSVSELTELGRRQLAGTTGVGNAGIDEGTSDLRWITADEIVDAEGRLVYETWLFMREDGVVYGAGTVEPAAWICQFSIDAPDPALVEALHEALWEARPSGG